MKRNVQLLIAYDGTDFHGWQAQGALRTVQATIEEVVRRVVRHPLALVASGRTDAGVHAAGQVANFHTTNELPVDKLRHAIGSRLPKDIDLLRVRDVPLGFHATCRATCKLYRYRIFNHTRRPTRHHQQRYVYHYYKQLDYDAMRRAARHFVGTHDFKAMASTRSIERQSNVRTILYCESYTTYEEIRIDVCGTGFLYNQVRNMVGTLLEIGRGKWPPERVTEILKSRDRQNAGPTVPAQGLCLQWVQYPPDHVFADGGEPDDSAQRKHSIEVSS